ncbi:MAG: LysR family transcriptional regulator [Coriobacteriales bacterium]|jgi:DNA-binding transcriptional LysR family regulator
MNVRQLEYFVAIAEEQQITAAARRLHITQPPLSYELASLERELGTRLVVRSPRKVTLTSAGKLLYERATQILALVSTTTREVAACGKGMRGTLSIGSISSSGALVPSPAMRAFCDCYPDVTFDVREGNTYEVLDMLENGAVELGIIRTPFKRDGLRCVFADPEPMMAVGVREGPGAARGEAGGRAGRVGLREGGPIDLGELAESPLVLYRRFESLVREQFGERDLAPFVSCVNDDARTTFAWARAGFGVGLLPASILGMMDRGGLVARPVACDALMTRQAVVWDARRELSPLAERFVGLFPAAADADRAGGSTGTAGGAGTAGAPSAGAGGR